jgi:hypothetical protein
MHVGSSSPRRERGAAHRASSPRGRLARQAAGLSGRRRRKIKLDSLMTSKKFSPRPGGLSPRRLAAASCQASGQQLAEGVPPSLHSLDLVHGRDFASQGNSDATISGMQSPSSVRMGAQEFVRCLERDRSSPSRRRGSDFFESEIRELFTDMRTTELQQLAFTAGVPVEDVEEATYGANPHEALVALLVRHSEFALQFAAPEDMDNNEGPLLHGSDEEAAAIAVQRHARGASARRAYAVLQTERGAARTVQSTYGHSQHTRTRAANLHKSKMAAQTIQARYRGGRTRRQLDEEHYQQACDAATLDIQRHWRGRQGRREAEQAHPLYGLPPWAGDAATAIQSRWRGGKSRDTLSPAMEHHRRMRNDAAAMVQARYRGSAARREAMEELQLRRVRRFKRHVDIGALISIFQVNDADGSATLSWENFSEAIFSGQVDGLTHAEDREDEQLIASETICAIFDAADVDSDGYLVLDEFLQFLGLSQTTISAWRIHGPSAGVLWLNGIAPPGWMTESWIRQGELMTARRQLREAKTNTLRELRWPPSPHTLRQRQLHGGDGHLDSGTSPVPGSPMVRAQELARSRGAVSRLQAIDSSSGVGQIDSESSALGLAPRSPTKTRALELARQRHGGVSPRSKGRGSPRSRSSNLRGGELSARAEEMRKTPRASRQLIAKAREHADPHAGLSSCQTIVLETPRHTDDRLTREEQDDKRAQAKYDGQTRPLRLEPASTPQKISLDRGSQREEGLAEVIPKKVSPRSSQRPPPAGRSEGTIGRAI